MVAACGGDMMKGLLLPIGAVLASIAATVAEAQPVSTLADGRSGKIEYESITPTGFFGLVRRSASPRTVVTGVLTLPEGTGKVPAMIIAHGSGGVSDAREGRWTSRLNEIGIAAFYFDSFGPRGIRDTVSDQSQLSPAANVADALMALRLLATHPRIDVQRIGIMGFSRGGGVSIHTALEPIRRSIIDGPLKFAVHVPFYPPCNTMYKAEAITGAPIRFMLGGSDDYTPAAYCPRYIDWFRSKGADADSIVYEGAQHGFDGNARVQFINTIQTGRNCDAEYDLDRFVLHRLDTDEILRTNEQMIAYYRGCSARGATIGGNYQATQKAASDLAAYLKRIFKL
jgi:dienelactone hydrolase